jgi:DNA polymerase-3 subunit alpha
MPKSYGIPLWREDYDTSQTGAVSAKIRSRIRPTALARKPTLPGHLGLSENENPDRTLRDHAERGLRTLVAKGKIADEAAAADRLRKELGVIVAMGFSNYFLIVERAIGFARSAGIPVGPGRGSAAGSMAAYCLGITKIDPLKHELMFERFINPDRISLPDIDTDFCEDRRHEVFAFLANEYGDDRVAHISTYSTRKPRGAVRTAARILNMRGLGNRLVAALEERMGSVKGLSEDLAATKTTEAIDDIAKNDPDEEIRRLAQLAAVFLGVPDAQGIHPGGIVLSDEPLRATAPLQPHRTETGRRAVQYDMHATEACGLVKFDFLGLSTLTAIQDCLDLLRNLGIGIDIDEIPQDDENVFKMIRTGKTRTVFQLESGGISQSAKEIGVDSFEDIVALVALYRPGPMGHIQTYASRKRGDSEATFLHPSLESALGKTYGIVVYQEQAMAIAQDFAGYTLAEADILRKAIGKKNAKALYGERANFVSRATNAGHPAELAEEIFDFIVPFAQYGFNRSHAVAYATITYRTAWLKHHHPAACQRSRQ